MSENSYDVFIAGETIDLCVPSIDVSIIEQWYKWFNDPLVTANIMYGIFPNTFEAQQKYCESLVSDKSRISLLIKPKNKDYYVGIASISQIDYLSKDCDFTLVIGRKDGSKDSIFYGMETKALMTSHAFDNLGVERINSGQTISLAKWQDWQILFGYQIEGIHRKKFKKGRFAQDVLYSSCLLEDYLKILSGQNGKLWPGKAKIYKMMRLLSNDKHSVISELLEWMPKKQETHLNKVINYMAEINEQ